MHVQQGQGVGVKSWVMIGAILVVFALAMVIVGQRVGITNLGYRLGAAEAETESFREHNRQLGVELTRAKQYPAVEEAVKRYRLPLVPPGKRPAA